MATRIMCHANILKRLRQRGQVIKPLHQVTNPRQVVIPLPTPLFDIILILTATEYSHPHITRQRQQEPQLYVEMEHIVLAKVDEELVRITEE